MAINAANLDDVFDLMDDLGTSLDTLGSGVVDAGILANINDAKSALCNALCKIIAIACPDYTEQCTKACAINTARNCGCSGCSS